jgi:DNA-binding NtrC family response regulator
MDPKDYTILIADDEESARFLYSEELTDDGYKVLTAENGLHVLGTLEDTPVDLLLTDVKMPDMNAIELIPRVRKEFPDLPIIIVSAFKGIENDFTVKESRISAFFTKPVSMLVLKVKIREILENRQPVHKLGG